ncbi:SAM pointed domain-containing Ets transcription factor-like [Asterias amurensis]|uniref:SAM pointed domain-containing Ets transcription factor-like n=1 Tax=Asterias amurensis TaxID=7602 RepID=UPI003AB2B149
MSEHGLPKPGGNGRHSVLHEHPLGKVLDLSTNQQSRRRQAALTSGDELQGPSTDPRLWKRSDVSDWLLWAVMFYQVDQVDTSKFAMNGRGLCLLTRSGFISRAPSCGDILHSDFQRRYAVAVVRTERERRTNRRRLLQVCSEVDSTGETKRPKLAEDK